LSWSIPPDLQRELTEGKGPTLFFTRNNLELSALLARDFAHLDWTVLAKGDVRGWNSRRLFSFLRSRRWGLVLIEDRKEEAARRQDLYRLLILVSRARCRWLLASSDDGLIATRVSLTGGWPALFRAILGEIAATTRGLIQAQLLNRRLSRSKIPPGRAQEGKRVAVLRTSFWFGVQAGGSVSHALGVLSGMEELGLEPRLWTTSRLPLSSTACRQTIVEPDRRPSLVEDAAVAAFNRTFLGRVEDEVREFDPAVIYHRHDAFSLIGLALARRLGVPLVLEVNASEVWARDAWSRLHFGGLARAMERTAFAKSDRLVLISEELVPTVAALGGTRDRIVVSPNGVDVGRFDPTEKGAAVRDHLGLPEDAVLCGFLGTFTSWHGVLFLAEQVASLAESNPRLFFLFLGDGDLRPEVELRLQADGVSDRARFTGLVDPEHVPSYLAACDILLSPHLPFEDGSIFFGSPTKLFEYMAAGRSVIASRMGQIGTVVEDGRTGILYPPGRADAFQEAIRRLAGDRDERERMGRKAREAVEAKYTWKANVRRALAGILEI
jgi:glycosyltransferase involved in cell wall biosynthesis